MRKKGKKGAGDGTVKWMNIRVNISINIRADVRCREV